MVTVKRFFSTIVILAITSLVLPPTVCHAQGIVKLPYQRPMVAIWCDLLYSRTSGSGYPLAVDSHCLQVAIWEDGRVIFAEDAKKWSHKFRQGKLSKEQVAVLKKRIKDSGVFALDDVWYVTFDASDFRILACIDNDQRMMGQSDVKIYADAHTPRSYTDFKACWASIEKTVLEFIPASSKPIAGKIQEIPSSWYVQADTNP